MRLGEVVKNYLKEHDMSLRSFARLSGITPTNLSYIINGKTPRGNEQVPSIHTYRKIADAMGMDVEDLIGMVDDKIEWGTVPTLSDKDYELVRLFHSASDRDKELVLKILNEYKKDILLKVGS